MKCILYFLLFFVALLHSCSKQEREEEIISLEDWAGDIGTPKIDSSTLKFIVPLAPNANEMMRLVASLLPNYDTLENNEFHVLDRFGNSYSKKIIFKSKKALLNGIKERVNPLAEMYYYNFPDSTTTKNAFYNWLDCFGTDCTPVNLKEDVPQIKMPPTTAWIYDTTIVVVNYSCDSLGNDWVPFEDSIVSFVGKNFTFNLKVECEGSLEWK